MPLKEPDTGGGAGLVRRAGPGPRTARSHAYGLLHGICATAVADGLLADNPCHIQRVMNTPRQRQPVILTVAGGGRAGRRDRAAAAAGPGAHLRVVRAALG